MRANVFNTSDGYFALTQRAAETFRLNVLRSWGQEPPLTLNHIIKEPTSVTRLAQMTASCLYLPHLRNMVANIQRGVSWTSILFFFFNFSLFLFFSVPFDLLTRVDFLLLAISLTSGFVQDRNISILHVTCSETVY